MKIIITENQYTFIILENYDVVNVEIQKWLKIFVQNSFILDTYDKQQFKTEVKELFTGRKDLDINHLQYILNKELLPYSDTPEFLIFYYQKKIQPLQKEQTEYNNKIINNSIINLGKSPKVSILPTEYIDRYSHANRLINPITDLNTLKNNILINGFEKPLELYYDENNYAVLWEGNHRLAVAKILNIPYLPVTLNSMTIGGDAKDKGGSLFDLSEFKQKKIQNIY